MAMAGRPSPDPDFLLRGSTSPIMCVIHTKIGVLSGTQKGEIQQWDQRTRRIKKQIQAHAGGVASLIERSDHIFSQGRDGWIKQWDHNLQLKGSIPGVTQAFCAAVHMSHDTIAVPTSDQTTVALVSTATKQTTQTLVAKTSTEKGYGMCMCLKSLWSETMKGLLVAGYENGTIALWNTELGKESSSVVAHSDTVLCMDYSDVIGRGVSGSVDEKMLVWTISKDDQLMLFTSIEVTNPGINCVQFRDDGKILLTGGWDGQVRVFSAKTFRPLAVLDCHKESVTCISFHKNQTFCAGSKDNTMSVWSVYKNK